jgi:hypothetical protein
MPASAGRVGLTRKDCETVCNYAIGRIGFDYDLRNILDLMRYLVPLPVPRAWRRRMIALGSGSPTRMICSALIAQAFEAVRFPILPNFTVIESETARREMLDIRHSSLYVPRDFDVSPYFMVIKPSLAEAFNYKRIEWVDLPAQILAGDDATQCRKRDCYDRAASDERGPSGVLSLNGDISPL